MRHQRLGARGILPAINPITVVVSRFDDLLQGGLLALLDRDESILTVATGVDQRRLSVVLSGHRPDVALIDAGALEKLADVRELVRRNPRTKLVLFSHHPSAAEAAQALAFGASAYLDTATESRDVLNAVHLASRGLRLTPDGPASSLPGSGRQGQLLTAREAEILPLLRDGRPNAEIALGLGVGIETIRSHTRNIYKKLGVSSRRELLEPTPSTQEQAPEPARPGRQRPRGIASVRRGGRGTRSC